MANGTLDAQNLTNFVTENLSSDNKLYGIKSPEQPQKVSTTIYKNQKNYVKTFTPTFMNLDENLEKVHTRIFNGYEIYTPGRYSI